MTKINFLNESVDKTLPYMSISNVLGMLSKPFDQEGVAKKTFDKNFNNPDSKYYGMSVQEIIDSWSAKGAESCRYGSLLDDYIGITLTKTADDMEMYKLDNNYDWDERLHGLCDSFDHFYKLMMQSGDMEFVDREQTVYYKTNVNGQDYLIKGRFDALFRNKRTGKWVVIDWKSSGSIDKSNRWEKLLGPAMKLDACNWNTYTMQVYFYKKTLIESGYLPEGTTEDDVEVLIVHMPGYIIGDTNQDFEICKAAFPYNSVFMDQIYSFAIRKNMLLKKNE